jgi:hypothetical protein
LKKAIDHNLLIKKKEQNLNKVAMFLFLTEWQEAHANSKRTFDSLISASFSGLWKHAKEKPKTFFTIHICPILKALKQSTKFKTIREDFEFEKNLNDLTYQIYQIAVVNFWTSFIQRIKKHNTVTKLSQSDKYYLDKVYKFMSEHDCDKLIQSSIDDALKHLNSPERYQDIQGSHIIKKRISDL